MKKKGKKKNPVKTKPVRNKKKIKKKVSWSKGAAEWVSCVFNYKNVIKLKVMETKNWKLSYGLPNKLFFEN